MIKNAPGRMVVSVNLGGKNSHRFADGTEIALIRQRDNFNRRYTEPVNATVVASDYIDIGTSILIGHNSCQAMYKIYNFGGLSGKDIASNVRYYAIPEEECFAYLDGEEWKPARGFEFALRVYRPHAGDIIGIPPKVIKNVLYVTTGELQGTVVHTLKASDYEIIFQGTNGREDRRIRFRHWDEIEHSREEVIAIDHGMTEDVNEGRLVVGLNHWDAVKITEHAER